ncbi:MarR family winged helix-turn-helix transcriptional regulator [Streptomyces sp. NPDC001046]|uniref:MarR family winged helix-turn-helix transcriptional regulator n=1 Tax=Streptomyces sp. NPDC001046 TaxID=3364543 RepID=UPI0036869105
MDGRRRQLLQRLLGQRLLVLRLRLFVLRQQFLVLWEQLVLVRQQFLVLQQLLLTDPPAPGGDGPAWCIEAAEGRTRARWQVLSALSGRPMTAPQAVRRLGVSRQAVQRVVNDLLDDALVASEPHPDQKTSPLLTVTEAGRRVLDRITAREAEAHEPRTAHLTPEGLAPARAVLRTVNQYLRDHAGD